MMVSRHVAGILILALLIVLAGISHAEDEFTEDQKKLQADIEHSLIAPCCWNMTVDQHDSQAARQVREKVSELIRAGKNKKEILAWFTSQPQYGERILATPSQDNLLGKMAYWMIPLAFVFGAFVIYSTVRSLTVKPVKAKARKTAKPSVSKSRQPESEDLWAKRVEKELNDFES